ncbi:MAG: TetR/AcrR family transcriptional regulator [Actinomycetota bacterium]|nr:TetR/AcrR family transcriptional regulator [Actinomycetota bacterium]
MSTGFGHGPHATSVRRRNRRGEGQRLRSDIVAAASTLVEETGHEEAVTLRAVARRVGIAAPSIYPHFADRQAMLLAVKEQLFRSLILALEEATPEDIDPVVGLHAGCAAYLRFAADHPAVYQALFGETSLSHLDCTWPEGHGPGTHETGASDPVPGTGVAALDVLVVAIRRCVNAGRSASTVPFDDAVGLWVALHGMATLTANTATFPWPDLDELMGHLVDRLARIVRW